MAGPPRVQFMLLIRPTGRNIPFAPGLDLEVVGAGEYRDCLLVRQHRYFIGGGSYDWFWLLRPDGKEVGPVGGDTENFKATYLEN